MSARYARGTLCALGLLCVSLAALAQGPSGSSGAAGLADPTGAPRLIVTVHTRNDSGRVFCALWRGRDGYPTDRTRNVGEALDRTIENHRAVCTIEPVSAGEYAVAVFHDENANNNLDRNFLGIPSEGTGASNDAYNAFGPPSYDAARFRYPHNTREHRITIHVHY